MVKAWMVGILMLALAQPALSESPAEFYKGRTLELYISTSTGGGYDSTARILARHIGSHISGNPTVITRNMPGSGGIRLANFLYNAAPKTGSVFGIFNRGVAFDVLRGNKQAQFDPTKFNWIGSTSDEISLCIAWHTSGVLKWEQVRDIELVVGSTGESADNFQFPTIANAILGTKFKMITGYPGGSDLDLALERGEIQGRCGWSWTSINSTRKHWVLEKKLNILFQMALEKDPDLPDVPLIMDLAKSEQDREILRIMFARQLMAWPFAAPPDVPEERVAALREAFMSTMQDAAFRSDAAKGNFDIKPVTGLRMQQLVRDVYSTPDSTVQRFRRILQ